MEHSIDRLDAEVIKSKSRKTGLLLMLVFIMPVVIAYGLLKTGVYQNFGTFNKGQLLNPPVQLHAFLKQELSAAELDPLQKALSKNWWIAYEMPEKCLEACQQRLLQIRQSLQTIGADQYRVHPLILAHEKSDPEYLQLLSSQLDAQNISWQKIMHKKSAAGFDTFAGQNPGGLYVIDPMGNAMLYYAPVTAPTEAISQAKSVIKDLKYLLKVSRIG